MLSIDNPPPDPPCPFQFPHLNSSSGDERTTHKLPLPEIDLPNPPSDHHAPLSNFSIRDYVFTARSKDIKKNWPFSLKNLQLCLKHGVKDVLPPFQHLDALKNQSFCLKRCTVETKQNKSNFDREEPSKHYGVLDSPNDTHELIINNSQQQQLAEPCLQLSSRRSEEENDFPSTTTSEKVLVPDNGQHRSPSETRNLLKSSVDVEAAGSPASETHKCESASRPPGKKCRLIVKFGGNSDHNSTEDITSNCTTASETMASKICPVCKTFSSSSNTTLNAHIDQCLSEESTPKWTAESKLTRHRIKPRKTRTMVDVYATALRCTLEELDRRNGRSWATVSCLPSREIGKTNTTGEGKKQRVSPLHPEDAGDVGPVYIDSNGTKLRILSKFSDSPSVAKVGDDSGAIKPMKAGKGCKYISKKNEKRLLQKHQKYLKLAPSSKKNFCLKTHGSQICGVQEAHDVEGKHCEKEHQMPKQIKPNNSWTLRPWVCSKPRGFSKRITSREEHQPVSCKWHLPRELLGGNDQSFLGDSSTERNHVQIFTNLSEKLISSQQHGKRREKPFHSGQVSNKRECSPGRKTMGSVLVGTRMGDHEEMSFPPMKHNVNPLHKDGTIHDSDVMTPRNCIRNRISSMRKKQVDTCKDALNKSDISLIASTKSPQDTHASINEAMRFSPFRKSVLSVSAQSAVAESRPGKTKQWSALKKSQAHFMEHTDEEAVAWHSYCDQYCALMDHTENQFEGDEISDEVSHESSSDMETRQGRGLLCISQRKSSKPASPCYSHDEGVNTDSLVRGSDGFLCAIDSAKSARNQAQRQGEAIVMEQPSKTFDGRNVATLSKSGVIEMHKLNNSSKVQSDNLHSIDDYRGLLCETETPTAPVEPDFVNDQEIFSADEVGNEMMGQNAHMVVELDSDAVQGSSFPEVDPIPIPGPPGSFLPSPRDMGSEDFQGNSSLTTSRVQSSPDQHEVVDQDSTDSPISAASTVSNSTAGRSDFNYSERSSSQGPYSVQNKIRSCLTPFSVEPSVQNAVSVPLVASTGAEERTTFDGEYEKFGRASIEKASFSFKNDLPCCCQSKERISQAVALNHQESQPLRRRKMTSVTVPVIGKQMGFSLNPKLTNLDVRPELFSSSSCSTSGYENVVLPVTKPLIDPLKESPNTGVRVLAHTDCDSASPSASNPILRLMGKNLMVVNKVDDALVSHGNVQSCAQNNHPTSQFPQLSTSSPCSFLKQDSRSFHHMVCQGRVISGHDPHTKVRQCFDVGQSNCLKSHSDLMLPQAPPRVPAGRFRDQHTSCFATSMMPHADKGDYNFAIQQDRLKNRLNMSPACHVEKVAASVDHQCKHADSPAHHVKEIIVIDDIPETETIVINDVAKYTQGWRHSQVLSSGISGPAASNYSLNHAHPFSSYNSQDFPTLGESPVVCSAGFDAMSVQLANTSYVKRGCISESSVVPQWSPYVGTSSSSGHLRYAALYYSPSYS